MLFLKLTVCRCAVLALLLIALVALADGIARMELTRAMDASYEGMRTAARPAGTVD